MAYQAIYRKWRPLVFDDIIGQTHITRTLKNQIQSGKIAHAYLFCGTRGTGKTTAAKVFSRAVNCEHPQDGSPCNECDTCRGILDGSILDVSEIDAASNNGVDSIREIREDVHYVATHSKYRVYIIDEVHMLSTSAFNALLKTLEEPPGHVIFILATTEAHRVPETILSRCQRFDFKRIRPADIILRMKEIAVGDGLNISEDAYRLLGTLADGSMRDGLSILERCIAACGTTLSRSDIVNALGMAESELIADTVSAITSGNSERVLQIIDTLSAEGKDLNLFIDSLIRHFRDLLICKVTENPGDLLDLTEEDLLGIKSQAQKISFERISDCVTALSKAMTDAKWLKNPRIVYEMALIKLSQPALNQSTDALLSRIEALEEQIKNGVTVVAQQPEEKKETPPPEKKKNSEPSARLYAPLDVSSLTADSPLVVAARKWDKIAQAIAKRFPFVAGSVINRKITIDGEGILLLYQKHEMMLKKIASTYLSSIQEVFQKHAGEGLLVKVAFEEDVSDHLVDYWKIGGGKPSAPVLQDTAEDTPTQPSNPAQSSDPLDTLCEQFPEIVELTDESDFVHYESENFEQTEIDEDSEDEHESDQFLEPHEKEEE